jgi:pimeloyl-ACP methyl ester carboxylesterase
VTKFIDLGGQRLESVWHGPGPGEAPTLVFLHEGLGSVSAWRGFPEALAQSVGCGALVYSRLGYGASDRASRPWPVRFMHEEAQTLPRVLRRLGVREFVLVGHSDGASIALILAGSGGAAIPPLGLLLEAPHVFVEPVCLESIRAAKVSFEGGELRHALARHHATDVDSTFGGWSDVWLDPEFQEWNIRDLLPRITAPVLAIQGEQDPYGTLAQVESVAAGCGGFVELDVFPDCGHSPHRDRPEATLAVMAGFLRREVLGRPGVASLG